MVANTPIRSIVNRNLSKRQQQVTALLTRLAIVVFVGVLADILLRANRTGFEAFLISGVLILLGCGIGILLTYLYDRVVLGVAVAHFLTFLGTLVLTSQVSNAESAILALGVCMITLMGLSLTGRSRGHWVLATMVVWLLFLFASLAWPFPRRLLSAGIRNWLTVTPIILTAIVCLPALKNFRDFSLRIKLLFVIVGLAATAVMLTVSVTGVALANALIEEFGVQTVQDAEIEAQQISLFLIRELNLLNTLSNDSLLRQKLPIVTHFGDDESVEAFLLELDEQWRAAEDDAPIITSRLDNDIAEILRTFQAEYSDNIELFVTDKFGGLIASTARTTDYYQADEDWWQEAYSDGQGNIFVSNLRFDSSSDSLGLIFAVPIWNNARTEIVGILRSTYLPQELGGLIDGVLLNGRAGATVLIADQQEIYSDNGLLGASDQRLETTNLLFNLRRSSERYQTIERDDGLLEVVSIAVVRTGGRYPTVDSLRWELLVSEPLTPVFDTVGIYSQLSTVLAVVVLLIVYYVIYRFSSNVLTPIEELTEMTQSVQERDFSVRNKIDVTDEIGVLASVFNEMVSQMGQAVKTVEERVADRVKALETSFAISSRLVGFLTAESLAESVVQQLQDSFGYSHVHLYLVDENETELRLVAATGEEGQTLLATEPTLALDEGCPSQAALLKTAVLIPNIQLDDRHKSVGTMPDTVSEIAAPILFENRLLAIVHVQQTRKKLLNYSDVDLLQLVVSQLAVAFRNVEQYAQTQRKFLLEKSLRELREKILRTNQIDDALQVGVEATGILLPNHAVSVKLAVEEQNDK